MNRYLKDLQNLLNQVADELPEVAMTTIEVEGMAFIKTNFRLEAFIKNGANDKWQLRKTTDKRGRDITRYRTNRRGKKGSLTKFGRQNADRPILTGHNTGGDKLRNSFQSSRRGEAVVFSSYKRYAQRHNEGLKGMPKRQFMGESDYLDYQIEKGLTNFLDNKLNK